MNNRQDLFGSEYFEEGQGLENKRVYNYENTKLYFQVIADSINNTIRPQRSLDIGCAKGYLVCLLNELNIDAYGVDMSSYAISCAPEKIRDRLKILDIEEDNFPFPDSHFDLIIILETLEHLASFEHLLFEIRRILNNGGHILITTPAPQGRNAKVDHTHINVQPKKFWIELFNKFGFVLVRDDLWRCFKAAFLAEFKKVMPQNPPSTNISRMLLKMGKMGGAIRNNFLPYIDYFFPLRSNEILLFKKNIETF